MPPCPPPPNSTRQTFPYSLRCVLLLAGPDVIIMWSVYLSVLSTCREKPFSYLLPSGTKWILISNIYLSRQRRPILTEPSQFVQVSCICTDRWEYKACFQFDHENANHWTRIFSLRGKTTKNTSKYRSITSLYLQSVHHHAYFNFQITLQATSHLQHLFFWQ